MKCMTLTTLFIVVFNFFVSLFGSQHVVSSDYTLKTYKKLPVDITYLAVDFKYSDDGVLKIL